jgi:antitoxin component HigA of HigAB toxin-antitoxin module
MSDFIRQIESELNEDRELKKLTRQEELILDTTELILARMEQRDINKSQLAKMLDMSKSHITHLLRGSRNMTLRTVSDIFFELGYQATIDAIPADSLSEFLLTESFVSGEQRTDWTPNKTLVAYKYNETKTEEKMAA